MNTVLSRYMKSLKFGEIQSYKNLTLQFLHGQEGKGLHLMGYDEAIEKEFLKVSELGDGGTVPELKFRNDGGAPVFIPEGTVIEGLKQSRTIRVSFIINHHQELTVPVHCVEQGRWNDVKLGRKSSFYLHAKLRATNLKYASKSLREGKGFYSDSQSVTWRQIKEKMMRMRADSQSDYAGAMLKDMDDEIKAYAKAFTCPDTANGLLAMIEDRVVVLDCFAHEKLFRENFSSLLTGLVLESVDTEDVKELKRLTVDEFLKSITVAKDEAYSSVGQGKDIRFENDSVVGCALTAENKLIHLEAFALERKK